MSNEVEAPMAGRLKAMALVAARKYRDEREALEREARALVLCPPDCEARHARFTREHAHTYWDMLCAAPRLDYAWKLEQARREKEDVARIDLAPHLRRAGVGDVHLRSLEVLDMGKPAIVAARKWLGQPRDIVDGQPGPMPFPWLALLGVTGSGKTQAAVSVLAYFVRRHPWNTSAGGGAARFPPFIMTHASELSEVARGLRDFSAAGPAREREEELRRCRVLVLDDVGTERLDADTLGLVHSLADLRYRERRVTVWTANLSAKDFEARMDFGGGQQEGQQGRLWRRIREIGAVVQLGRGSAKMKMGEREITLDATPGESGR